MLNFKKITLADLDGLSGFFAKQSSRACDYTAGVIFMWGDGLNYSYAIEDGIFFLRAFFRGRESFYPPIGENKDLAYGKIDAYCQENGVSPVFFSTSEEYTEYLKNRYPGMAVKELHGDYLYDAEDLKNLPGKKYHSKKNHINRFKRDNPDFTYRRLELADLPKIYAFLDSFYTTRHKLQPLFNVEKAGVEKVLENYSALPFVGGILEANGQAVAFSVGEIIGDTLFIHIEKAFVEVSGAYAVINQEFAKMYAVDKVKYINREDDAGDEGLAKAKLSYHPIAVLQKCAFQ